MNEIITQKDLQILSYEILEKVSKLTTYTTKVTYNLKLNQYEIWIEIRPISNYKSRYYMFEIHKGVYSMYKHMWNEIEYRLRKYIKIISSQIEQEWVEEYNEELEEKRRDNGKI